MGSVSACGTPTVYMRKRAVLFCLGCPELNGGCNVQMLRYHRGRTRYCFRINAAIRPRRGRRVGKRAFEIREPCHGRACRDRASGIEHSTGTKGQFRNHGILFVRKNPLGSKAVAQLAEPPATPSRRWQDRRGRAHSDADSAGPAPIGRYSGCSCGRGRVKDARPRLMPHSGCASVAMASAGARASRQTRSAGPPALMP